MFVAHIIIVHKEPRQLQMLLSAMKHPRFHFFIHVDRKVPIDDFAYLENSENVFLIRRRAKVVHGGYGTVEATLFGFREILERTDVQYSHINVMSGQDYPVKSVDTLYAFLSANPDAEFVECLPAHTFFKADLPKLTRYSLVNYEFKGRFRVEMLMNYFLPLRKFPLEYTVVGKSNWFTITTAGALYILDFLKKNPSVVRFFKHVWGADEFIFSTILYNSPFRDRIRPNLMFVDWAGPLSGYPKVLDMTDLDRLMKTDKFIARKFELGRSLELVNVLNTYLIAGSNSGASDLEKEPVHE